MLTEKRKALVKKRKILVEKRRMLVEKALLSTPLFAIFLTRGMLLSSLSKPILRRSSGGVIYFGSLARGSVYSQAVLQFLYLESDKPLLITPSLISSRAQRLNDAAAFFTLGHLGVVSIISCKFLFHFSPQGLFDCSISHEGFALVEKAYHSTYSIVNNVEKPSVAAKVVSESKSVSVGSETGKTSESKPLDHKSSAPNPPLAGHGKIILKMKKREASKSDVSTDLDPVVADEGSTDFVGC